MMTLALELETGGTATFSAGVSAIVAALALALAVVGFSAARKRGNRALYWVSLAFLVFTAKNVFSAVNVLTHAVPHDMIELVLSLADFVILALLFIPLIFRRRA